MPVPTVDLQAKLNIDQVAVSGMSFGGTTSINVLNRDTRFKAGVMLAPGGPVIERQNADTPVMMIIGTEDSVIRAEGNERNRNYYENSEGPRYLVEILGYIRVPPNGVST